MDGTGGSYPEAPKRWVVQRYKFGWRLICISNLALGAYIFSRTPKKEKSVAASKVEAKATVEPVVDTCTPPPKDTVSSPPIPEPVIEREPVIEHKPVIEREPMIEREPFPAYQQRELFKWMLEEKRKTKPNNLEEEERINEEKALLEQYIRTLSFASYMFVPEKNKTVVASKVETKAPVEPVVETSDPSPEDTLSYPPIPKPVIEREPVIDWESVMERETIPAYQQQELFKWMLEEKRKTKPKNREEEERINEEKALLEQYIHSNTIPSI